MILVAERIRERAPFPLPFYVFLHVRDLPIRDRKRVNGVVSLPLFFFPPLSPLSLQRGTLDGVRRDTREDLDATFLSPPPPYLSCVFRYSAVTLYTCLEIKYQGSLSLFFLPLFPTCASSLYRIFGLAIDGAPRSGASRLNKNSERRIRTGPFFPLSSLFSSFCSLFLFVPILCP